MTFLRSAFATVAVVLALALQTSLMPHLSWQGVVPNLVLLVVVAASLTCSPRFAMVLAFGAGAAMDLAPPADHYAGRWALALVLVAWFVSVARQGGRPSPLQMVGTVAASSFVAMSVFALSGVLLKDPVVGVGETLAVILAAVVWDVVVSPLVLPWVMKVFRRLTPEAERERP